MNSKRSQDRVSCKIFETAILRQSFLARFSNGILVALTVELETFLNQKCTLRQKKMNEISRPGQNLESFTVLQRIGNTDRSAVEDCVNAYGSMVWFLARKYAKSPQEAEESVLAIFDEIWRCAERFDPAKCTEENYVMSVAVRHLLKRTLENGKSSTRRNGNVPHRG